MKFKITEATREVNGRVFVENCEGSARNRLELIAIDRDGNKLPYPKLVRPGGHDKPGAQIPGREFDMKILNGQYGEFIFELDFGIAATLSDDFAPLLASMQPLDEQSAKLHKAAQELVSTKSWFIVALIEAQYSRGD